MRFFRKTLSIHSIQTIYPNVAFRHAFPTPIRPPYLHVPRCCTPLHPQTRHFTSSAPTMSSQDEIMPDAGNVVRDGKEYTVIKEGLASILIPAQPKTDDKKKAAEHQQVFYNPIQQFNRDLSVIAVRAFKAERDAKAKEKAKPNKKRKREGAGHAAEEKDPKVARPEGEPDAPSASGSAPVDVLETEPEKGEGKEASPSGSKATAAEEDAKDRIPASEQKPDPPRKSNFSILDALSASGLRALRYAHEIPFAGSVTANDLTESAVTSIKRNIQYNKLEDKITVSQDDALAHMYRRIADSLSQKDAHGNPNKSLKYDVIDLDPYGTAAPFLDAAVQAVKDGGMLSVTCTDSAVWAGHCYCEKSYVLYGGVPVKNFYSHEAGLRLILHAIATSAARYSLTIEPLLSVSVDYYVRIFVRVHKSQAALKFLASKTMLVYNCDHGCGAFETQYMMRNKVVPPKKSKGASYYKHIMAQAPTSDMLCRHCGSKMHLGGPMYGGYIHSPSFIQRVLDELPALDEKVYGTIPRIEGMLQTCLEEFLPVEENAEEEEMMATVDAKDREAAKVDPHPFYMSAARLAAAFQTMVPNEDMFRGALRHLGYQVTRSHCKPGSFKTDAPWSAVFYIMREWVRQKSPVKKENIKRNSPAWKILGLGKEEKANGETSPETEKGPGEQKDVKGATAAEKEQPPPLTFDEDLARLGREKRDRRLVRYQLNPRENWGPMTRAKGQ